MPLTDTRELQHLARLRQTLEQLRTDLAHALRKLDATPEGETVALARNEIGALQSDILDSEAVIRGTALEHYDGTGEKEPWPAVKIKLYTMVRYDPKTALAWAKENSPNLLTLNKSAFERAVKAGLTGPMGAVGKEPRAQIARDLSQYLPTMAEPTQEGEDTEQ